MYKEITQKERRFCVFVGGLGSGLENLNIMMRILILIMIMIMQNRLYYWFTP